MKHLFGSLFVWWIVFYSYSNTVTVNNLIIPYTVDKSEEESLKTWQGMANDTGRFAKVPKFILRINDDLTTTKLAVEGCTGPRLVKIEEPKQPIIYFSDPLVVPQGQGIIVGTESFKQPFINIP